MIAVDSLGFGTRLMIELPWAPGGHPITGLDRECVLKCWWVVPFLVERLIRIMGTMPSELAQIAKDFVVTAVKEKKVKAAANPDAP